MLVRWPMMMSPISPLITVLYQILAPLRIVTFPIIITPATKKTQDASAHLCTLQAVIEKTVLLVAVSRDKIASCAETELHKSATVDTCPTCATPEIRYTEKLTGVVEHSLHRLAGIGFGAL